MHERRCISSPFEYWTLQNTPHQWEINSKRTSYWLGGHSSTTGDSEWHISPIEMSRNGSRELQLFSLAICGNFHPESPLTHGMTARIRLHFKHNDYGVKSHTHCHIANDKMRVSCSMPVTVITVQAKVNGASQLRQLDNDSWLFKQPTNEVKCLTSKVPSKLT
jgi:hypothetical protein